MIGLALAGGLAMLSALTKGVGITLLIAMVLDLAWQRFRPGAGPRRGLARQFGSVFLGVGGVSAIALLPFVIAAPGELVRQAVFFQLLRPRTETTLTDRISALWEKPEYWPILVVAGLGLAVVILSLALPRMLRLMRREPDSPQFVRPPMAGWSLLVLWAVGNALVFASTPRVFAHYQLHVLAALALIAAGLGLIPRWLEGVAPISTLLRRWELPALILVLGAVAFQQFPSWTRGHFGSGPTTYGRLSTYINETVPSEARLLVLDARVTLIAGREPNHGATGYLADPYGHLVYLGLELRERGFADLVLAVVRREKNSYSRIARSPSVQADLLARFAETDVAVVNDGERSRLGPAAQTLDAEAVETTRVGGYLVYTLGPAPGS
jgi:hypothetical protein